MNSQITIIFPGRPVLLNRWGLPQSRVRAACTALPNASQLEVLLRNLGFIYYAVSQKCLSCLPRLFSMGLEGLGAYAQIRMISGLPREGIKSYAPV